MFNTKYFGLLFMERNLVDGKVWANCAICEENGKYIILGPDYKTQKYQNKDFDTMDEAEAYIIRRERFDSNKKISR